MKAFCCCFKLSRRMTENVFMYSEKWYCYIWCFRSSSESLDTFFFFYLHLIRHSSISTTINLKTELKTDLLLSYLSLQWVNSLFTQVVDLIKALVLDKYTGFHYLMLFSCPSEEQWELMNEHGAALQSIRSTAMHGVFMSHNNNWALLLFFKSFTSKWCTE